jgi:2-keto-4-pentenoate hydratase/2-oxohepta-3-ene-1,7-dioic acid hydratase in catechol pathway
LPFRRIFRNGRPCANVIEAGGLEEVADAASGRPVTHPHGSFTYEIPVPAPEKIICVGVNFPDRNAEYKDGQEAPPNMSCSSASRAPSPATAVPLIRPPRHPSSTMKARSPS